jgi:mono/diheme cytochrome c family protein
MAGAQDGAQEARMQSRNHLDCLGRAGRTALGAVLALASIAAQADAGRGAQLYLRTDSNVRSCVSCHGPDPGQNHNNILRAAADPATLTRVLNTVSPMGFLRQELTDQDRVDITDYLAQVVRLNTAPARLRLWPLTLEFGAVQADGVSAAQMLRLSNPSATQPLAVQRIGAASPQLQLSHACPTVLAPGADCAVSARLAPGQVGLVRTSIEVATGSPPETVHIGASASGVAFLPSALAWQGQPASLEFRAGTAAGPQVQALTLVNPGPASTTLALASIVGPDAARWRIEANGCAAGLVLAAGAQCVMSVAYAPDLAGSAQAVLQLRSDQGNPPSVVLQAVASATEPAAVDVAPGGGCSTGAPGRRPFDPLLALLALAAIWAIGRRARARRTVRPAQTTRASFARPRLLRATGAPTAETGAPSPAAVPA